ncbi:hypothetical protein KIN20_005433 [Parelaphostrongylus tenuis]|uniref:Uncharacterized protein n=1 Tax=Parelaphostrongylus tenuis TaxID=148309 RepID=A0AAD5QK33_PARTN|nr:hypothetical protein KIN20_005433 [Parelaphostrongylus tenuis]
MFTKVDRESVTETTEEDLNMTTDELVDNFDCGHATFSRTLKAARRKWKKSRWIPYSSLECRCADSRTSLRNCSGQSHHRRQTIFPKSQRCPNHCLSPGQRGTPIPRPNQFASSRGLTTFLESKNGKFYEHGIDWLPERWQKCVQINGEYFE